ncbi:MAG TPA: right-handed parallel beta-helix repeat-containing protein [Candidatus Angelobacter sp.]|nr:right-handed parallel beta-helix repeat-containing protein [Candidatus Angelobacter sp.]
MRYSGKPKIKFILSFFGIVVLGLVIWQWQPRSVQSEASALPSTMQPAPPAIFEYYVSPRGNDAGDGSATSPWATIQHAANVAGPGALVHVTPGKYIEAIRTTTSGNSAARITFRSDAKWGAKIIAPGSDSAWENRASYVDIEGFDITGSARLGILNQGSFVRIMGNHIHDIPAQCGNGGGAGINNANYQASDNDVVGNLVHDIGSTLSVKCGTVQGIYHANLRGHIMNNIVYRAWAYGIHLWHAPKNVVVANNLVFQNGEAGILVGAGDAPGGVVASGIVVVNNMILNNPASTWGGGQAIIESGLTGADNKYSNNLIWSNKQGIVLQNGISTAGTIKADPRLEDYRADGSGNYHLSQSSPAIAAGTVVGVPPIDFDGHIRPAASRPDIGPYQSGAKQTVWPWAF